MDSFIVRGAFGKIAPLAEVEGAEGAVCCVDHNLGVSLKKQSQGAPGSADINRLP